MRRSAPDMAKLCVRVPRGQDGFWAILRALDAELGRFTIADIEARTNADRATVKNYLRRLIRGGFLEVSARRPERHVFVNVYRLLTRPKHTPRLKPDGRPCAPQAQDHLWRAMRTLRSFTASELAVAASTDELTIKKTTARRYVSMLQRAGYLARLDGTTFHLKPGMNTGPLSPRRLRLDFVWDPNRRAVAGGDHAAQEAS